MSRGFLEKVKKVAKAKEVAEGEKGGRYRLEEWETGEREQDGRKRPQAGSLCNGGRYDGEPIHRLEACATGI